jgi:hypothetical protein
VPQKRASGSGSAPSITSWKLTAIGLFSAPAMCRRQRKPKTPFWAWTSPGVEAVGSKVTRFQPGDEVSGWCDGSFAEYRQRARTPQGRHFFRTEQIIPATSTYYRV